MAGPGDRNPSIIDPWSFLHLGWGILLAWVMPPFWALAILVLYEPLELFVLSPLSWKLLKIEFGHESLGNVASDIVFDIAGVALGFYVLRALAEAPFMIGGP